MKHMGWGWSQLEELPEFYRIVLIDLINEDIGEQGDERSQECG